MQRALAGLIALAALGLAIHNAIVVPTGGSIGLTLRQRGLLVRAIVAPGGPAARAGIRTGDVIDYAATALDTRIAASGLIAQAGRRYAIPILRNGERRTVAFVAVPNAANSHAGLLVDFALSVVYATFCLLVIARAPPGRISTQLAWLLAFSVLQTTISDVQFTAANAYTSFYVGVLLQFVTFGAMQALLILLICSLPVGTPAVRRRIAAWVPLFVLLSYGDLLALALSVAWPIFGSLPFLIAITASSVLYDAVAIVALYWLARSAPRPDRVRVRWFLSTIVVCGFASFAVFAVNDAFIHDSTIAIATYYLSTFMLIGPVYATLRHQLVDLDVVLSRSTVYGIISLGIVFVFLTLEWLANTLAESQAGLERWGHATALVSFAAAIAIGLSVRPLHARIESIVNQLFFGERLRRFRLLESFATESDYVESRADLIRLTFEAVRDALETPEVSLYLHEGDAYARARTSTEAAPARLGLGDRLILQLLERSEPFVSEVETLHDWLIVPLRVRTARLGFIACGRKPDHTRYLADEEGTLDRVAHHVATSYALLQHE